MQMMTELVRTTILQQLINSFSWAVIVSDDNIGKEANGGILHMKVIGLCIFEKWEAYRSHLIWFSWKGKLSL